jgi:hypothetical protein
MEWKGPSGSIGIVMEDQKPAWPRILVFWFDFNEASEEQIEWMTRIRGQDNEA